MDWKYSFRIPRALFRCVAEGERQDVLHRQPWRPSLLQKSCDRRGPRHGGDRCALPRTIDADQAHRAWTGVEEGRSAQLTRFRSTDKFIPPRNSLLSPLGLPLSPRFLLALDIRCRGFLGLPYRKLSDWSRCAESLKS